MRCVEAKQLFNQTTEQSDSKLKMRVKREEEIKGRQINGSDKTTTLGEGTEVYNEFMLVKQLRMSQRNSNTNFIKYFIITSILITPFLSLST